MGDVLKIVGCGTVSKPRGFDARKHHPVTAKCTGEHETGQARWRDVIAIHGTLSVPSPRHERVSEYQSLCLSRVGKRMEITIGEACSGPSQSICRDACGPGPTRAAKRARRQRTLSRVTD